MCGSTSLRYRPHSPYGLKVNELLTQGNLLCLWVISVNRWPLRIESGSSLPWCLASCGL